MRGARMTPPRLVDALQTPGLEVWLLLCVESEEKGRNLESEEVSQQGNSEPEVIACVKVEVTTKTVVGAVPEKDGHAGYLGMLAVRQSHQSRGIGRWLVNFCESRLWALGERVVLIDVICVRGDVLSWYKRMGYEETGRSIDGATFSKLVGQELLVESNVILLRKNLSEEYIARVRLKIGGTD